MTAPESRFDVELLSRDQRQTALSEWAEAAFGHDQSTSLPQRGLRLLEEAIEAFQACGGDEAMAHKLVAFVFARPAGTVGQELGGVAVTTLLLAAAAGLSAEEEEGREIHRVLSKPVREFTERNANKNAAGFLVETAPVASATDVHDPDELVARVRQQVAAAKDLRVEAMERQGRSLSVARCPWAGCSTPMDCDGTRHGEAPK